jgi:hypothetical protein
VTVIGVVTAFGPEAQRSAAFSTPSLVLLVVTLVLFMGAVVLAQGSNLLAGGLRVLRLEGARELASGSEVEVLRGLTNADIQLIDSYRAVARTRLIYIQFATMCQMLAVVSLTAAVVTAVLGLF